MFLILFTKVRSYFIEHSVISWSVVAVPTTSPMIPTLPLLLAELNETREFFRFIKKVRKAFVDLVQGV
jgi:Chromosome segregation protein Spc25